MNSCECMESGECTCEYSEVSCMCECECLECEEDDFYVCECGGDCQCGNLDNVEEILL